MILVKNPIRISNLVSKYNDEPKLAYGGISVKRKELVWNDDKLLKLMRAT